MQALQAKRRRERISSTPTATPAEQDRAETPLFASVDLSSSSFFSPTSLSRLAPPASRDWTTSLSGPLPDLRTHRPLQQATQAREKRVRRAKSQAEWSTASSSSVQRDEAWEAHLAKAGVRTPAREGARRRSTSLSIPSPSSPSFPDSPTSSRPSRRSPSLSVPSPPPPRGPSPVTSWRARHESFTVRREWEGKGKKVRRKLSTLSLGALMGRTGEKAGEGEEGRLLPTPRDEEREKRGQKGSWEYQIAEALLFGGTPTPPPQPPKPHRPRPPIEPLNLLYSSAYSPLIDTSTPVSTYTPPAAPPPALIVQSPSYPDTLSPPSASRRDLRRASSTPSLASRASVSSSASSTLSFHSATSQVPFPVLFPAQAAPSDLPSSDPPLVAVRGSFRSSIQYSVRARSLARASFTSITSLSPPLSPSFVVDLTSAPGALDDLQERTEAPTVTDDCTVMMPFPPVLGTQQAGMHLFPPSPPVPLASQKQRKRKKLQNAPVGAWLFVGGFLCMPLWWVGAFWPKLEREREKRTEEKGVGNEKLQPPASANYTNFPRTRARSRTESALGKLLGPGASSASLPLASTSPAAAHQHARALVWRRRNRLMSWLSVVILAAVIAFAAWGATR